VYSIDSKEILSVDQMKEISDAFLTLRAIGFASVVGMPNERSGELGFMACCHVEEVVTSYKDSHPIYGFLASFFQQAQLNEITGLMCRIVYGYDSDYKLAVRRIISNVSAHQPKTVASD
jgi:acyl-CoA synthetase (AMP-forming)/AMP-acid ligase II